MPFHLKEKNKDLFIKAKWSIKTFNAKYQNNWLLVKKLSLKHLKLRNLRQYICTQTENPRWLMTFTLFLFVKIRLFFILSNRLRVFTPYIRQPRDWWRGLFGSAALVFLHTRHVFYLTLSFFGSRNLWEHSDLVNRDRELRKASGSSRFLEKVLVSNFRACFLNSTTVAPLS